MHPTCFVVEHTRSEETEDMKGEAIFEEHSSNFLKKNHLWVIAYCKLPLISPSPTYKPPFLLISPPPHYRSIYL